MPYLLNCFADDCSLQANITEEKDAEKLADSHDHDEVHYWSYEDEQGMEIILNEIIRQ
jgi:hypothetical protein